MSISRVTDSVIYVGVNDHEVDLFEGQYEVPDGMSYNSYVILGEKVAVMDTVSEGFDMEWLLNVAEALDGRNPDYLVIHHMEPDHSANIARFAEVYPGAKIVSSKQAFQMMARYFGTSFEDRQVLVKDGDSLDLGGRKLTFVGAPFVHWPEVLVSYDSLDKILFSADGFGKFGALDAEDEEGWACEAARYYFGIVGMYGAFVQKLLAKAANLDIAIIAPLHGPVLTENIGYYIDIYDKWSSYTPEREDEITIAYTSVYGHTREAVDLLVEELEARGAETAVFDLARDDMAEAVEDAFRNSKLVLATTTYNNTIFPFMQTFITTLIEHRFQKRTVGLIENGTWAPKAAVVMREQLDKGCDELEFLDPMVRIEAALDDKSRAAIAALADALVAEDEPEIVEVTEQGYRKYVCRLCGWEYDEEKGAPQLGIEPGTRFADLPADFRCPLCSVGVDQFDPIENHYVG